MHDVFYQWFVIINEPVSKFVSLWTEIFSETCHICNVWLWTNVDQCHGNLKKTWALCLFPIGVKAIWSAEYPELSPVAEKL